MLNSCHVAIPVRVSGVSSQGWAFAAFNVDLADMFLFSTVAKLSKGLVDLEDDSLQFARTGIR